MKKKLLRNITTLLALVLCILFGAILMMYASPMEDAYLDLSLMGEDAIEIDPEDFNNKGWTVYTQEENTKTELTPDGYGGYSGLELGQTFYFSRVMSEELDDPTLQLGAIDRTFSVWLDDDLIYTDLPELDNRIGYLTLPMNDWERFDPIIISLPVDYQGKMLTIAQSFPEYSETNHVKAFPTSVNLYCGYAYESGLISESFVTAIVSLSVFLLGIILLLAFVRNNDWSMLCLSMVAFIWMSTQLIDTTFFWRYFGNSENSVTSILPLISSLALLIFLTLQAKKHRKIVLGIVGTYAFSVIAYGVCIMTRPVITADDFLGSFIIIETLPLWLAFISTITILVMGTIYWRKEIWFYRIFTPLTLSGIVIEWFIAVFFVEKGIVWSQIMLTLRSGQITYIYYHTLPAVIAASLITAIIEFVKNEMNRRMEQRLIKEHREMEQITYDSMYKQHEEVMKIRHDMIGHLETLRGLTEKGEASAYIDELIGQNKRIRPIVHTGNNVLDIILNSKLSTAIDEGIQVEVLRSSAPEKLPLTDVDLSALMINILNNALTAASNARAERPFIKVDIHVKGSWLSFTFENSADIKQIEKENKKETVPKHGLGLKIVRNIAEKYNGLFDTEYRKDYYKVSVIIPLD